MQENGARSFGGIAEETKFGKKYIFWGTAKTRIASQFFSGAYFLELAMPPKFFGGIVTSFRILPHATYRQQRVGQQPLNSRWYCSVLAEEERCLMSECSQNIAAFFYLAGTDSRKCQQSTTARISHCSREMQSRGPPIKRLSMDVRKARKNCWRNRTTVELATPSNDRTGSSRLCVTWRAKLYQAFTHSHITPIKLLLFTHSIIWHVYILWPLTSCTVNIMHASK